MGEEGKGKGKGGRGWRRLFLDLLLISLVFLPGKAKGGEEAGAGVFQEITSAQEAAINRAAEWLGRTQNRDGSWHAHGGDGAYACAMTGLAGLALLACGNTPARGKFGAHILRGINFLLKCQDSTGLICTAGDSRAMYGHGFAMTFLAECYGMGPGQELGPRIKDCLTKAVKLTQRAQSSLGGWYYSPNSSMDEGSVTITQVQALRACRNVGIEVAYKVLERAIDYIKKSQQPDGGIAYRVGMTDSRPALTAAGAELLMMAGQYQAPETRKAIEFVKKYISATNTRGAHDSYTTFYTAQAMHQEGGKAWEQYFQDRRKRYLAEQGRDGSWQYSGWGSSSVFDTAVATIVLCLPFEYLPIYQR
jgi:squalene cyclase